MCTLVFFLFQPPEDHLLLCSVFFVISKGKTREIKLPNYAFNPYYVGPIQHCGSTLSSDTILTQCHIA